MSQASAHGEHTASSNSEVSPTAIVDAILGYHKTAAMKAAIGLDLFTAIARGSNTVAELADQCSSSQRGIRSLCDYLTVFGFLDKDAAGYALTPSAAVFLDQDSPAYMGSVVDFFASSEHVDLFLTDPVAFVKNGGAVEMGGVAPDNPVWVKFAKAMIPFITPCANGVAAEVASWSRAPRKVLDIAAGHGIFGITVAKALPNAEIVAVDWKSVLALAELNAVTAGVQGRYRTLPGSAFEVDWGSGYDLILLPNFLHHFDRPTCVDLLKKVRSSLGNDGRAVAVEFVPNEDRVSPPFPASFSFHMLATTPKGDAYTRSELAEMAANAGFQGVTLKPLPPSPQSLVVLEL